MKQDYVYNTAIAAFIFWAAVGGKEAYEKAKQNELLFLRMKQEAKAAAGGYSDPTAADVIFADAQMKCEFTAAEIRTLEAVNDAMTILGQCRVGREIKKAVNMVYFIDPPAIITKDTLKPRGKVLYQRACRASLSIPASISEVYEWLAYARITWAWKKNSALQRA
jgi:hypothetical protein